LPCNAENLVDTAWQDPDNSNLRALIAGTPQAHEKSPDQGQGLKENCREVGGTGLEPVTSTV
jgi:hypothetical protein